MVELRLSILEVAVSNLEAMESRLVARKLLE